MASRASLLSVFGLSKEELLEPEPAFFSVSSLLDISSSYSSLDFLRTWKEKTSLILNRGSADSSSSHGIYFIFSGISELTSWKTFNDIQIFSGANRFLKKNLCSWNISSTSADPFRLQYTQMNKARHLQYICREEKLRRGYKELLQTVRNLFKRLQPPEPVSGHPNLWVWRLSNTSSFKLQLFLERSWTEVFN